MNEPGELFTIGIPLVLRIALDHLDNHEPYR